MDSEVSIRHKLDLERMLLDTNAKPSCLALSLLEHITNNFSDGHQIGRGGFAVVYKGTVGKGVVAVKKLSRTFDMHEIKFHKEVECLMKAKHKNIVRFLGYCCETHGRAADYDGRFVMADLRNWLLCFEYVPNGSVDKYITDASCGLEWRERYQMIKGICEGLLHLHEKRIIHLDLKPGNILIDDHMVPKIADFGLSRCLDKDQTRVFTSNLCGSQGYLAPEFYRGEVAFASDIYSLGVIIVEILTGEKGYPEDENVVVNWKNRLEGSYQWVTQLEQVRVCTKIGIECLDSDPKKRPVASHIIDRLEKTESAVETGISSSSVEQQRPGLAPHFEKKIKERAETEELAEYDGTLREDHWYQGQQEASGDRWSSWREQDMFLKQNISAQGARISSSNSGVLYKLSNLDIFNKKAPRNFLRNGGPMLVKSGCVKIFRKGDLKPILKDSILIGKGDFGEVYKGLLVDNVPVVLKKLNSGNVLEEERFANEIILQSRATHINIVKFIGCCLEADTPMLVYEFLSNGTLHDILHTYKERPLSLGQRLSIAAQLASGLHYLHSNGSILGNFKPENIVFSNNFVPKINFGMSSMAANKFTGMVSDDMAYMDPLCLQSSLRLEESDVYSFGVVLMELLTRKKSTLADSYIFLMKHKKGVKSTELFDKEIVVAGNSKLLDYLSGVVCVMHWT